MTPATASPSLVERLREYADVYRATGNKDSTEYELMTAAADAIEALTADTAPEDAELVREARGRAKAIRYYGTELSTRAAQDAALFDRLADRLCRPTSDPWCYDMEKAPVVEWVMVSERSGTLMDFATLCGGKWWRFVKSTVLQEIEFTPHCWMKVKPPVYPAPPTSPGKGGQP